jgi:hypothetical protein
MQYHKHVTDESSPTWSRCNRVELKGEDLVYMLDPDRRYNLLDKRPQRYIRFLNLRTDQDLMGFVKTWGPLFVEELSITNKEFWGRSSRALFWDFKSKLTSELELVQSFRSGDREGLEAALLKYISATDGWTSTITQGKTTSTASELSLLFTGRRTENPKDWISKADISRLREVASWCVGSFSLEFAASASWRNKRPQLTWEPRITSLAAAIQWELWDSAIGAPPLTMCEECRTVFLPETAHPRKFCTPKCAHRVAMRMWRKSNAEGQPKKKRRKDAQAA